MLSMFLYDCSGQLDLLLPYWGSKHLYSSLQWSGKKEYEKAPNIRLRLTEDGPVVGCVSFFERESIIFMLVGYKIIKEALELSVVSLRSGSTAEPKYHST